MFAFSTVLFVSQILLSRAPPPPSVELCDLINAHRVANNVSAVQYSASLFYVAEVHRFDIDVTWSVPPCNMHSWQNNTPYWTGCCYDSAKPATYSCMFNKPAELVPATYPFMGAELSAYGCSSATCTANAWISSPPHNAALLSAQFVTVGCAQSPNGASSTAWFGRVADGTVFQQCFLKPFPPIPKNPGAKPQFPQCNLPSPLPTPRPSAQPTVEPTAQPSAHPTVKPSVKPTVQPTAQPTVRPSASAQPSASPTRANSHAPSISPTTFVSPSTAPSRSPSAAPTAHPVPSVLPTAAAAVPDDVSHEVIPKVAMVAYMIVCLVCTGGCGVVGICIECKAERARKKKRRNVLTHPE